jgi:hypothetical protein
MKHTRRIGINDLRQQGAVSNVASHYLKPGIDRQWWRWRHGVKYHKRLNGCSLAGRAAKRPTL